MVDCAWAGGTPSSYHTRNRKYFHMILSLLTPSILGDFLPDIQSTFWPVSILPLMLRYLLVFRNVLYGALSCLFMSCVCCCCEICSMYCRAVLSMSWICCCCEICSVESLSCPYMSWICCCCEICSVESLSWPCMSCICCCCEICCVESCPVYAAVVTYVLWRAVLYMLLLWNMFCGEPVLTLYVLYMLLLWNMFCGELSCICCCCEICSVESLSWRLSCSP